MLDIVDSDPIDPWHAEIHITVGIFYFLLMKSLKLFFYAWNILFYNFFVNKDAL
jgi:hypothetical protein